MLWVNDLTISKEWNPSHTSSWKLTTMTMIMTATTMKGTWQSINKSILAPLWSYNLSTSKNKSKKNTKLTLWYKTSSSTILQTLTLHKMDWLSIKVLYISSTDMYEVNYSKTITTYPQENTKELNRLINNSLKTTIGPTWKSRLRIMSRLAIYAGNPPPKDINLMVISSQSKHRLHHGLTSHETSSLVYCNLQTTRTHHMTLYSSSPTRSPKEPSLNPGRRTGAQRNSPPFSKEPSIANMDSQNTSSLTEEPSLIINSGSL